VTVGLPATQQSLNARLGQAAIAVRNAMQQASALFEYQNNLGTAGLEAAGFSAQDAASYQQMAGYLSTLAGVYNGTVQQGGSGGTGASTFNFDNALSATWGGQ